MMGVRPMDVGMSGVCNSTVNTPYFNIQCCSYET